MRCVTLDGGRSEDGWRLPSDPPCREAMGRGTVAAGDGGGAATSRHSPSVSASRCHLPIASRQGGRSEEHTSELQSLMRISYADICLTEQANRHMNRARTPQHRHDYCN